MKVSAALGGLLLFMVLTHGLDNVLVTCTDLWLQVKIRRSPIVDNLQPQHYELFLGNRCSVTRATLNYFEFIYPLTSCGIRKYDSMLGILVESSVTYVPVFLNMESHCPISCSVPRKLPFAQMKSEIKSENKTFGEISAGSVGRENSTSSPVGVVGISRGESFRNSFSLVGLYHFPIPCSKEGIKL